MEEKLYTKTEVEQLFEKARIEIMDMTYDGDYPACFVSEGLLKSWLKENLKSFS